MDLRDFDFWVSEAKRQRQGREMEEMERMRLAMWAEAKDFSNLVQQERFSLLTPEQKRRMQDQAWLSLKAVGRG
jgi:hypothetical protein